MDRGVLKPSRDGLNLDVFLLHPLRHKETFYLPVREPSTADGYEWAQKGIDTLNRALYTWW